MKERKKEERTIDAKVNEVRRVSEQREEGVENIIDVVGVAQMDFESVGQTKEVKKESVLSSTKYASTQAARKRASRFLSSEKSNQWLKMRA